MHFCNWDWSELFKVETTRNLPEGLLNPVGQAVHGEWGLELDQFSIDELKVVCLLFVFLLAEDGEESKLERVLIEEKAGVLFGVHDSFEMLVKLVQARFLKVFLNLLNESNF